MTTVLILFSFVLHAIALFAIILLYTRQNRLFEVKQQQEQIALEVEEMMNAYLLEMKEENERFLAEFSKVKSTEQTAISPVSEKVELTPEIQAPSMNRVRATKGYKAIKQSAIQPPTASLNTLPKDPIMDLKEQGFSIEEIAKKLNKGKTEVELALKFAKTGKNS